MKQTSHFNAIQILGIILSGLGLICVAFPTFVGLFAVRAITFLFLILGFYSLVFALFVKSKLTIMVSFSLLIVGLYAFVNPQYVLFMLGIGCFILGLNGIFLTFSKFKKQSESTLISSIALMLLGVFAMLNTKAALSSVIMILGIIIVFVGIMLIFVGNTLPIGNRTKRKTGPFVFTFNSSFAHQESKSEPRTNNRVIINIDEDDVEEIEYKDVE